MQTDAQNHSTIDAAAARPVILLVDDEPAVRTTLCRWLERSGYSVLPAENGLDALGYALWPGQQIDLVITDIDMPRLGGIGFVEQLNEAQPGTPVLYVSGYPRSIFAFLDDDPTIPFLQKPFALAELSATAGALIRKNSLAA